MGSRLSRQSSLEEEGAAGEEANGGKAEGGRGDFHLSSLLLHPQRLPGVLRKASPAPYVRRVGWLREIQATIREHKREHAVHILRLLRKVSAAGWAGLAGHSRAELSRAGPPPPGMLGQEQAGGGSSRSPLPSPPGRGSLCCPAGVAPSREQGSGAGLRSPQEKGSPSRSRTQPRRPPRGKPPATPLPPGPPPRQAGQELAPGAAETALGRLPGTARAGRRGKGVSVSVGACFCLPPFGDREGSVQTAWCQSDAEHRAPLLEQSQLLCCSALPSPSRQTRLPQIAGNSVINSRRDRSSLQLRHKTASALSLSRCFII